VLLSNILFCDTQIRKSTSGFGFSDDTRLGMLKPIRVLTRPCYSPQHHY